MNKITINGVEIEFGPGINVIVGGGKVNIQAAPAVATYPQYPSPFWQIPLAPYTAYPFTSSTPITTTTATSLPDGSYSFVTN